VSSRIADYGLLGDCHGAALAARDGSIDWWCPPRFDARSIFARVLDPHAGHWSLRPRGGHAVERRYLPGTLVLETTFRCDGGVARLTEALALGHGVRGHEVGRGSPHVLVRRVEAVEGEVHVELDLAARPDYGLVVPRAAATPDGVETVGGPDRVLLTGDRPVEITHGAVRGSFVLGAGEDAAFALHHLPGIRGGAGAPLDARAALEDTVAAWRSWSRLHDGYRGAYAEEVRRSALVLQALTYVPSGAIVAAPTTSLPEVVGAAANWDYRFSWLRDASLTLKALWVGACPDEAHRFFDWMARAAHAPDASGPVQIMFGVEGERDLTEHELSHLVGHRDSRPVRIGNDAWRQRQLDVLGEVLEGAWVLREQLGELSDETVAFLAGLADRAARDWREPDAGIWEAREGHRHYVSSKLLCWVALERALGLLPLLGPHAAGHEDWRRARDELRAAILTEGWSEAAGAFGGAFGSDHLDASVLLMPILGFLPATDERMHRTIDAVERELSHDGLVQRWTGSGDEGAFVICSYWLVQCRALAGEVERARELFEHITAHANDLGLLSEEIDIHDGELLGNFPQGFSHIGLINAAWRIDQATTHPQGDGAPN
jgi:GH15 family glucan-1,4-alpha-glucosidase